MLVKENVRLQRIMKGTWRSAALILLVAALSSAVNEFLFSKFIEFPVFFPSLLGTTLAFFIGFNNNQAYSRWWEARIIAGAIVGLARSFGRQCISYIPVRADAERLIRLEVSFLYALKEYLRNTNEKDYEKHFPGEIPPILQRARSKHSAIMLLQQQYLDQIYSRGSIDGFKFMQLNETLNSLSSEMGKAERIRNTVFPTTYKFYTKLFIWIFIVSVTVVLNNSVGMIPAAFLGLLIGYVYYISHKIGETLLNPFLATAVGVPLDHLTRGVEIDLKEVLGETDLPAPLSTIQDEYIL